MPASVRAAPRAASRVAGEPVAGSWVGAADGATAGTIDAGRTWAGWVPGALGTGGTTDARGLVDELDGTLEDDEVDGELLDDDELGGTLEEELLELDDEELDELDGVLLDEDELGGTLDEELLELDDELLDELDDDAHSGFTIDVLEVSVVAPAGALNTAMSPSSSPAPSTDHPALALPFMTHPSDCAVWNPRPERTPHT